MKAFLIAFLLTIAGTLPLASYAEITKLTGVIYQNDHDFVIAETENMKPIAVLQGVEFATDNFANFVGKTVRVSGTLAKVGLRKVLRVRTLADVEEIPPTKK